MATEQQDSMAPDVLVIFFSAGFPPDIPHPQREDVSQGRCEQKRVYWSLQME